MLFGSLLEGYFYNSFMKARTSRFLSVLHGVVYSSLSLHFGFDIWLLLIGNYYTFCTIGLSSLDFLFCPKLIQCFLIIFFKQLFRVTVTSSVCIYSRNKGNISFYSSINIRCCFKKLSLCKFRPATVL